MNPKITRTLKYSALGIGAVGMAVVIKKAADIADGFLNPVYIVNGNSEGRVIREGGDWWRKR